MPRQTRASADRSGRQGAKDENAKALKGRRSHTKSRSGCAECKRRHIRCDERQPACANCEVAERECFFPPPKVSKQKQSQWQQFPTEQQQWLEPASGPSPISEVNSQINATNSDNFDMGHVQLSIPTLQQNDHSDLSQMLSHQPSGRSSCTQDVLPSITGLESSPYQMPTPVSPLQLGDAYTPPANFHPGFLSVLDVPSEATFTPQHMILLHLANTVPNYVGPSRSAIDIAIRYAVSSPYLLDEVLAFTAFHLVNMYPGSAVQLRHLATELQNRALASFTRLTEVVPKDDKATAVPRFMFSAILGRHVLADTLTYCRADFRTFIDQFVECFNLNRGIKAVTPPVQDFLYNSEVQPFLDVILEAQKKITASGNDCEPLNRLMSRSDLSSGGAEACRQAIESLQWAFDVCHHLSEDNFSQAVSAFSVRINAGYVDVLRKHQPEALVILAYYGVLLHRCRTFWAFGDAGAYLIRAIASHLGSYWQEALAWPLQVLEAKRDP